MSEYDPTDLAASADHLEAQKAAQDQEQRYEIEDLKRLMNIKWGRRIMWRLLAKSGVYRLSYERGDALATAFNEGQRNQGLRLMALLLEHASSDYALMVQERTNG